MYANSIAIKAYGIRTAAHHLQATFTWASAVDLGQGLCADVADLIRVEGDLLQRRIDLQRLRCRGSKAYHVSPTGRMRITTCSIIAAVG